MTNETMILHPQNTQMKNATSKIPQLFKIPQIQTTHIKHEIYNFITLLTPLSHRKNLQEHNLTQKLLENNQQPNKKQTYNQTEKKNTESTHQCHPLCPECLDCIYLSSCHQDGFESKIY